jgi:preprotein translocase subunit SecE
MEREDSHQSIVNFGLVMAGFLAYYVSAVLFEVLSGSFGAITRLRSIEAVKHGVPVTFGLITFLILYFNKNAHVFLDEAVTEVRKVVWPSRKDTVAMTTVCCVMVVMAGLVLAFWDLLCNQVIKLFVN